MTDTMTQGKPKKPLPTWTYAAGAAGVALLYFLYSRSKASSAAAAANASGITNAPVDTSGDGVASTSASDLATALADLSQGGAQATTTGTTAAQWTPPTNLVNKGSGLGLTPGSSGTETDALGQHSYSFIPSAKALQTLLAGGQQVYYQPTAGVFMPFNPKSATPGTPTYLRVS